MKGNRGWVRVAAVTLIVIAATVGTAEADGRAGSGEIGFDLGVTYWDGQVPQGETGRFSLRGGYHVIDWFQLEGQLGRSGGSDPALTTAFLNGVFNFRSGDFLVPYFLVGGGAANMDLGDDDTAGAAQIAGGARAFGPGGRVGLRLELGFVWENSFDSGSVHANLTVGMTFILGKRHEHRRKRPGALQRNAGGY